MVINEPFLSIRQKNLFEIGTFKFRRHYGQMSPGGLYHIDHLAIIRKDWKAQPLLFS